ncbi:HN1_G0032690.mRNA.1.CDS.1 [Saccharomyces cerevisiae]|nr:HN1_G0032690.mRNA.1.CDS.1 [Saccharomyces cerevisiae]CAI4449538.1 BAL_1a_G0019120.mRNA.1.CDS.1 [Saccharomyces cerevisiae]CAI7117989.1 BAL_1a_G0019120.mRNA.1.CDS.1 [Saccharomyces cerevisiae]
MIEKDKRTIAFIHPDLGIGGAERLVVDAALGLQQQGHSVIIYTSHCDKSHCFEEVKNGQLKVEVYGDFLPTNFLGRFFIVFATIRQLYLVIQLILQKKVNAYQLIIIDQLSTCIPLLHIFSSATLMFYCHFPDQLLAQRAGLLKKIYRLPFDLIEQFSVSAADTVVVNSNFTKNTFHQTFKYLSNDPDVIYPCVDLSTIEIEDIDKKFFKTVFNEGDRFYLSINRFEKKKDVALAIKAFALSEDQINDNVKLVICGGYDERVAENVEYLKELQSLADEYELSHTTIYYQEIKRVSDLKSFKANNSKIIFLTSISSSLKELLLERTEMLLYTPAYEHFGIVPLEAMKLGKPVLAVNNGGPLETIKSYVAGENESSATGWLKPAVPIQWATAIDESRKILQNGSVNFERNGPLRVKKYFSREAMTQSFEENVEKVIWKEKKYYPWEMFGISFSNFILHMAFIKILPNNPWPFLFMATFMVLYFKNYLWGIYWAFVFALSYPYEEI